jgi:hypothetical protein
MLKMPWQAGPADRDGGPVLVSVTNFELSSARDLPGAYMAAMRLRRAWPDLKGAVGLWLWAKPLQKRSGSISIWQGEEDLMAFVRWPVHVAIMRKYRGRGMLTSVSWVVDRFVAEEVWNDAACRLANGEISGAPPGRRGLG